MSRALNIDVTQDHVIATCAKWKVPISAIEPLPSGGTRVVMNNADDTATIAKAYRAKIIAGAVMRTPIRLGRLKIRNLELPPKPSHVCSYAGGGGGRIVAPQISAGTNDSFG